MRGLILLLTVGCAKPPDPAPRDLGQLGGYLFAAFEDDEADLADALGELEPILRDLPLDGDIDDRAFTMPVLDEFGGIGTPKGENPEDQLPVAVAGLSRQPIAVHLEQVAERNQVCIESDTTVYYRRTYETDADCFANGSCASVDTTAEVRKESAITAVWYDLHKDFRTIALEDGRRAMLSRSWIARSFPADNDKYSWDQFYTLEAAIEDGKRTIRFNSVWSAVTLGIIGPDLYVVTVKNSIDSGFVNADNFADGELCKNDRNRPYDR